MLLTVLIVFASATIAALVVQVTVGAAGSQQRRQAANTALETVEELASRTASIVTSDPGRIFVEVLDGESPRTCTLDQENHPDPIPAGEVWPASCGHQWGYLANGAGGMRIHPPTPTTPEMRIEIYAKIGEETAGKRLILLPGGRTRPGLYFATDAALEDLGMTITLDGVVYSAGTLDVGSVSIPANVALAAEKGFPTPIESGTALTTAGSPGAETALDLRTLYPLTLGRGSITAAAATAKIAACSGEAPRNTTGKLSSLCIVEGGTITDRSGDSVSVPTRADKPYLLLVPVADDGWELYARTTRPAAWPGPTAGWGEPLGVFETPTTGIVHSDRATVIGNCDPVEGACTERSGDGRPGYTAGQHLHFLIGAPGNPQVAIIGGPLHRGDGIVAVTADNLMLPAGATAPGETLEVEGVFNLSGGGAGALLQDDPLDGDGTRPALVIRGALALGRIDIELGAFTAKSLDIDAEGTATPPWVPGLSGGYVLDRFEQLTQSELDTLVGG
jgi:hypothetical protein